MFRATLSVTGLACWLLCGWNAGVFPTADCTDNVRGGVPFERCHTTRTTGCAPFIHATDPCKRAGGVCNCSDRSWVGCTAGVNHPLCVVRCTLDGCGLGSCGGAGVGNTCGDWDG